MQTSADEQPRPRRRPVLTLALLALGCFAAGAALVALYNWIGAPARMAAPSSARRVTIRFIAQPTVNGSFEFRPVLASLQVQPGRLYDARFLARNTTAGDAVAQAVPSIVPERATPYFHKTECFCFTPQRFAAGEARELPVRFIVDPQLPADIDTLTLSYALYFSARTAGGTVSP